MTLSIEPLGCGSLTAGTEMFEIGGDSTPITMPVPSWLIRHPSGTVLFDCGMHEDLAAAGPMLDSVSLFFEVGLDRDGLVSTQLAARDIDAVEIDVVVLSHLHFDHAGGLALVPDARLVVQRAEWFAGLDDELAAANTFRREDYDLGHDLQLVDGEHDLFGDGRVACIPTPGHTPGHQSLRVRLESGDVVLCGDCAYFERTLDGGPLPPFGHDAEQQARSIEQLRSMRSAGARLVPGHDQAVWDALPAVLT
jgi:glyoxylase-like metal-dependent hydrolase (beta-lactamase superfamily II)